MISVVLPKRAGYRPAPANLPIPCSAHRRVSNGRVNRPSISGTAARRHWASACPARRPIRSLGPNFAAATPTNQEMAQISEAHCRQMATARWRLPGMAPALLPACSASSPDASLAETDGKWGVACTIKKGLTHAGGASSTEAAGPSRAPGRGHARSQPPPPPCRAPVPRARAAQPCRSESPGAHG